VLPCPNSLDATDTGTPALGCRVANVWWNICRLPSTTFSFLRRSLLNRRSAFQRTALCCGRIVSNPYLIALRQSCSLSGRDQLFVVRLRLLLGVRRRCCRRTLCLFCSAFCEFLLLTPFRLSPLLFLPLHFLLPLFERNAHRSPHKSRGHANIIDSCRVTSEVRAAGEPIRGNPHARIRCDRDHHRSVRRRYCCAGGARPSAALR
jgi:hypothetical protein